MATTTNRYRQTDASRLVATTLLTRFPNTPEPVAYQYNSILIRARIVDPIFEGKDISERERIIQPLLQKLPPNVEDQISLILHFAPSEVDESLMNAEYENPTESNL